MEKYEIPEMEIIYFEEGISTGGPMISQPDDVDPGAGGSPGGLPGGL